MTAMCQVTVAKTGIFMYGTVVSGTCTGYSSIQYREAVALHRVNTRKCSTRREGLVR